MDDRLIAVIERLSEDMANLAKAVAHTQDTLDKLLHEVRKNGKTQKEATAIAQRFLANQQPRWRFMENDDHD